MNRQTISVSNEMYSLLKELKEDKSISLDELATILDIPRAKVELLTFQLVNKDLARREVEGLKVQEYADLPHEKLSVVTVEHVMIVCAGIQCKI